MSSSFLPGKNSANLVKWKMVMNLLPGRDNWITREVMGGGAVINGNWDVVKL